MEPTPPPPLPNFLIIGAQKSATRWLRVNLGLHPQVFTATEELSYFDHPTTMADKGLDWYRQSFEGWDGEPLVGEATPGYMMWRHSPKRMAIEIDAALPEVRLLAVLRNPVDRARSALLHHIKHQRLPRGTDLMTLVRRMPPGADPLGLISGGWYAASLRPFVRRYGERMCILLHDDVQSDPVRVYETAATHIGAESGFLPDELAEVRFSNEARKAGDPAPAPTRAGRVRKAVGRRQRPEPGALERPGDAVPLSHEDRVELFAYFRRDVLQLERMIDRDLSHWDPSSPTSGPGATTAARLPFTVPS